MRTEQVQIAPNLANFAEYDIVDRIFELNEKGARLAREVADGFSTPDRPRFVLGSVGPGTKLPTLGHAPYAKLRDVSPSSYVHGGLPPFLLLHGDKDAQVPFEQVQHVFPGRRRSVAPRQTGSEMI